MSSHEITGSIYTGCRRLYPMLGPSLMNGAYSLILYHAGVPGNPEQDSELDLIPAIISWLALQIISKISSVIGLRLRDQSSSQQ